MSNPPTNNVDKTNRDRPNEAKPAQQQQGQPDAVQQQPSGLAPTKPADAPPSGDIKS